MFAAKNLLQSRYACKPFSATATSGNNLTVTPANFPGYISGASCITYNVPSGVVIGSTTIASYALTFSGFNPNDKIKINNSGKIVGKGGDGNSGAGGPALNVSGGGKFIINNNTGAIIASGGGAGGNGNGAYTCRPCCCGGGRAQAQGGGGGGGQGYVGGTGGPVVGNNSNMTAAGGGHNACAGGAGSITAAGAGGRQQFMFAFFTSPVTYFGAADGGAGGTFGSNGTVGNSGNNQTPVGWPSSGDPAFPRGLGGTAGNAIKGVGAYTLNNLGGTVYGPLIP